MLAGQESIYVKVEQGLDFLLRPEYDNISPEDESYDQKPPDAKVERKIADSDKSISSFEEVAEGDIIWKLLFQYYWDIVKRIQLKNPVDIVRAAQKALFVGGH